MLPIFSEKAKKPRAGVRGTNMSDSIERARGIFVDKLVVRRYPCGEAHLLLAILMIGESTLPEAVGLCQSPPPRIACEGKVSVTPVEARVCPARMVETGQRLHSLIDPRAKNRS